MEDKELFDALHQEACDIGYWRCYKYLNQRERQGLRNLSRRNLADELINSYVHAKLTVFDSMAYDAEESKSEIY